jgi:hypothetical protein
MAASVHAQTAVYNGGITTTINSTVFVLPMGVTTDSSGNVFVADNGTTPTVYEMKRTGPGTYSAPVALPGGFTCTAASTEEYPCLRGVAVDSSGHVWVAGYNGGSGGTVYELTPAAGAYTTPPTSVTGPAPSGWNAPWGVSVDPAGNVFVTDNAAATISEISNTSISLGTPAVTTVVSSGIVAQPRGLAVNSSDTIYAIDGNVSHVVAIASPYTSASIVNPYSFQGPGDLALDSNGNLWITEFQMNNIRELTAGSNYATVFSWGNGLSGPVSVWPDSDGTILLSDSGNHAIKQIALQPGVNFGTRAIGSTSATQTLTFTFTGASSTTIQPPVVVTQGATGKDFADALTGTCTTANGPGNPYIPASSCTVNVSFTPAAPGLRMGAVELLDSSGNLLAEALLNGIGTGPQLTFFSPGAVGTKLAALTAPGVPQKVAVDASGNVFVADSYVSKIFKIPAGGGTPTQVASGFSGTPYGFTVDGAGNLFIGDTDHYRILEVLAPAYTTINNVSPVLVAAPLGLAVDANDNIYVAEASSGGTSAVEEVTAASSYSVVKTLSSSFTKAFGIAVDASGNVFVADQGSNSITELVGGSSTNIHTYGSFSSPEDVAVDAAGNLYVADNGGGTITELTGGSTYPISLTLAKSLLSPAGVALDSKGNVYYSTDGSDNSVYELNRIAAPSLTFLSSAYQTLSTDSPQSVTVSNSGSTGSNLNLIGLTVTTTTTGAANSFSLSTGTGDCSATSTLTSGNSDESCELAINFTPQAVANPINGTVVLSDNVPSSPQTITLKGSSTKATPVISWATPSPISYGTTLAGVLDAAAKNGTNTVPGTFTYTAQLNGVGTPTTVTTSTVLAVGTYTLTANFAPSSTTDFNPPSSVGVSLTVTKATPTITWPAASAITYGQTLASSTLSGGSALNGSTAVAGSFAFTTPGTAPTAGTYAASVTFTPSDTTDYSPVTGTVNVTVNKATPTITWPTASDITYGQTLASSTLTGGSALRGTTNVPGAFAFTTPTTVPTAGTDPEGVTFTPTDTTDYNLVTGSVNVVVSKATPTITWPTASSISYSETLASSTLTGGSAHNGTTTVTGAFAFTAPTTAPPVGTNPQSVTFTPTDTTDYNPVTGTVNVTVSKATPTITWPAASGITYGQTLASSTLTGGSALNGTTTVTGAFAFATPTTVPTAGTQSESVTFTPTDTTDYNPVTGSVNVVVSKATPTITWPAASGITYGQTLASSTLTGGSALNGTTTVTGNFAFTTPTTVPTAGTQSEGVTFTPTDTTDYNPVTGSVNVVVSKATPTITWPTASSISYSQTLASSTLTGGSAHNGTTTVTGTFAFTTPTTAPPVGTNAQSVTFTPADTTDYDPVTGTVNVTVNKATPTITWPTASGIAYGQTLASSTLTGGSALNGTTTVTGSFAFTTPTTVPTAGTDSESVTFTPTDTTDYSAVTGTVTVVVSKATPTITWPTTGAITYGQTLASSTLTGGSALNGTTPVTGAFAFTTPTTVPTAGTDSESVTFTPSDTTNYNPVTGSVNVVVSKATPTITWPTATTVVYGQTLASSTLTGGGALNGATNVPGSFAFTTPTTAPPVGTSAQSVTFTPTDTTDYATVTGTVNVTVIKASLTITWPTASTITYGQTLASSTLTGGSALNGTTVVPGTFSFTTPTLAPTAGTHAEGVTFTPTDTTNNPVVAGATNVTVNKTTPTVTWPTASALVYGQTLASSTLTGGSALNGTATVTGAFTFTTPTTVPAAGTNGENVTFTPTDTTDYNSVTGSVNVTVNKATPTITWPTASSIVYGQTLATSVLTGGSALNGTTSVAGTFAFTTPTTVPPAGSSTQSVTFTPADTADYVSVTGSVSVNVIKGNMTITWPTASAITYGQTLASSSLTGGSAINGTTVVSGSFAFTTPTVAPPAGIQAESVTFTPTDTTNYSVVTGIVNVTVNKATPAITWPTASVIVHGQTLASSTLTGGSAVTGTTNIAGTFAFATPTTVPGDGNNAESVIFTPTDTTDYASVTGSVNVTVLDLTISASPASQSGTAGGTFTYTISVAPAAAGTPYPGTVTFAAIGGPSGAVIAFSPTSVAANAGPQTVTMSVATPATSAALHPDSTGRTLVPVALAFLLLPLAGTKRMRRNGQRLARFVCLLLLALGGIVATTALSGCGSNSGGTTKNDNGTQYTITVTAASGSVNPTTTVTLTLQ